MVEKKIPALFLTSEPPCGKEGLLRKYMNVIQIALTIFSNRKTYHLLIYSLTHSLTQRIFLTYLIFTTCGFTADTSCRNSPFFQTPLHRFLSVEMKHWLATTMSMYLENCSTSHLNDKVVSSRSAIAWATLESYEKTKLISRFFSSKQFWCDTVSFHYFLWNSTSF